MFDCEEMGDLRLEEGSLEYEITDAAGSFPKGLPPPPPPLCLCYSIIPPSASDKTLKQANCHHLNLSSVRLKFLF